MAWLTAIRPEPLPKAHPEHLEYTVEAARLSCLSHYISMGLPIWK